MRSLDGFRLLEEGNIVCEEFSHFNELSNLAGIGGAAREIIRPATGSVLV
jgi:hypothetical protein